MAVTLYRCERCRGVFSSVFGVAGKNYCRNCKFNLNEPYVPGEQGSGGVDAGGGVTIVEPKGETMGGGKSASLIGQQAMVDLQVSALAQRGMQSLMSGGQKSFSGGSEIRSPFSYSVSDDPRYGFKFTNIQAPGGNKIYNPSDDTFTELYQDGSWIKMSGDGQEVGRGSVRESDGYMKTGQSAKPVIPESSPHEAILKPSRKLKLLAE